jgi:4-hydroxythreonine-4-phosphate dehydrogenase
VKQPLSVDKPLVISKGDPAGVGPAATLKAWQALRDEPAFAFYVRGGAAQLKHVNARMGRDIPIVEIATPDEACAAFTHGLPVIPESSEALIPVGKPDLASAHGIIASIENAVSDVWSGDADAIVTNPIAKALLYDAGFKHPGHTEFLAYLAGLHAGSPPPLPIMMLVGGGLRVALATIHIPLMSVAEKLSIEHLKTVGEIIYNSLVRDFGIKDAKLGVCGLNPHAGEDGNLGREDLDIIAPAIKALNVQGVAAIGPRPGDTVFHEALAGQYDAVLAMYHDQGLIPVKTLDIWGGVNVTLGLPFVRTSPDHGTGYDAAASGNIRADSLIAAIRLARQMANHRKAWSEGHE